MFPKRLNLYRKECNNYGKNYRYNKYILRCYLSTKYNMYTENAIEEWLENLLKIHFTDRRFYTQSH